MRGRRFIFHCLAIVVSSLACRLSFRTTALKYGVTFMLTFPCSVQFGGAMVDEMFWVEQLGLLNDTSAYRDLDFNISFISKQYLVL